MTTLIVAAIGGVATTVPGQTPAPVAAAPRFAGRVVGVYDERTGNPIDSVEVRDMATGSHALTTSTGTVSLFFVDTTGSLIRLRKLGYAPLTIFVDNEPGLAPLTLTLEPVAQVLPTVVTTTDSAPHYMGAPLRGFEERRKTGQGYFIPESEIRKNQDRPLAQLIRARVPTVDTKDVIIKGARMTVVFSRRSAGSSMCQPDIFLDGISMSAGGGSSGRLAILGGGGGGAGGAQASGFVDLNSLQLSDLAAVEFHNTGDMPPEFNRMQSSGCGALFLWTREK